MIASRQENTLFNILWIVDLIFMLQDLRFRALQAATEKANTRSGLKAGLFHIYSFTAKVTNIKDGDYD